jgi:glycosyltransferase involved in cell wall biosynthesis
VARVVGGSAAGGLSSRPVISVVIPVRNGATHLPEQLAALAQQTYAGDWEVVVADNGSGDATRDCALARASSLPRLRVLDASTRVGVAHARNVGAAAADGEILVFCDADDRVYPNWLDAMVIAMREADAVGGALEWSTLNSPAIPGPRNAGTEALLEVTPPFLPFPSGANCAVHTALHRALGGFDERFVGGGDDVEFFWRLQLAHHRLAFAPEARVAYRERPTLLGAAGQAYRWSRSQPGLYREFRAVGMPRSSVLAAGRAWAHLVVRAPWYWSQPCDRRRWAVVVAERAGRLAGSVRYRALYL